MSELLAESALIVLVPEAEPLVGSLRNKYDPSAAEGVPAHVTVLYPFKQPTEIVEGVLDMLRRIFAEFPPFQFSLAEARRFQSGVLYLALTDAERFREHTLAVWGRFPETPPYAGRHNDVTPHLTVAQIADARQLDSVAAGFATASRGRLPINATVSEVALMTTSASGPWRLQTKFPLGSRNRTLEALT